MAIIAEELGTMIPFVGGPQYFRYLLPPLERLCTVEQQFVAEKVFALNHSLLFSFNHSLYQAVSSISLIIQISVDPTMEDYFMEMLQRIQSGPFITARTSTCSLIAPLLTVYPSKQEELLRFVLILFVFISFLRTVVIVITILN